MRPFFVTLGISCALLFYSCKNEGTTKNISGDSLADHGDSNYTSVAANSSDSLISVVFPEMTVRFNMHAVGKTIAKSGQDTIEIGPFEEGETFEGKSIGIESEMLNNITVRQRYETSVTISKEGEHFDLTTWKHYRSDWTAPTPVTNGIFIGNRYTESEQKLFPDVSMSDLKTYLTEKFHNGRAVADLIKQAKSVHEYPCSVGISKQYLLITGTRKDNGATVSKQITLNVAMGD